MSLIFHEVLPSPLKKNGKMSVTAYQAAKSWIEIRFTRANFLKEQKEIWATFLHALQLYLIVRAENLQPMIAFKDIAKTRLLGKY